jgi:import inner membrane translocase subunit TIM21
MWSEVCEVEVVWARCRKCCDARTNRRNDVRPHIVLELAEALELSSNHCSIASISFKTTLGPIILTDSTIEGIMAAKLSPLRLTSSLFVFRAGFRSAITTTTPLNARLATQSASSNTPPTPKRRSVTVVNDTGRIPWQNLSIGEKAARTTQQTFNLGLVLVGLAATGAVFTVLYLEVFSTDSKTAVFNRTADRVRKDPKCLEILAGEGMHTKREITAHGEPSHSRWARNRTIASRLETDKAGVEHLHMHFYVEGPAAKGTVQVHMTKAPGEKDFQYRTLALDVPGQQRHYLVNVDGLSSGLSKAGGRLFGVRWN